MIEKGIDSEKAVKEVVRRWENWKKVREPKEVIWDDCVKHYLTYIDEAKFKKWPWRCKVSRPVSQEIVDTVASAIKAAAFPDNEEFFNIEGLDDIGMKYADTVKTYLQKVLFKMRYVQNLFPFIKQLCIIGNSTAALFWRREETVRNRWQDGVVIPSRQMLWDSTKLETHDMFDVVFEPRSPLYSQETQRIRRKVINKDELKERKNIYSNLKDIGEGNAPIEQSDSVRSVRRQIFGINDSLIDKKDDVELLISNGDINIDGKIYTDQFVVVANRKVLLMFVPNPYWCGSPHIFSNYTDSHNELLGRGPLEPIRGLQKLIDTFSCQKADIANLIINGFWAYKDDGIIDPENLISRPFGMIPMEDVNNIKSLVPSANPTLAFNEIDDLRLETERSSGASKFAQGVVAPGRRTAREVSQISAGTSNRFNDIVANVGDMAIEPSLNMILQQEFQFNYASPLLPREAWEGTYKVAYHGARTTAVREVAIQMFREFSQVVGQNPVFAQFTNPMEFLKEWQKLLGIKNKDLVRSEPIGREFPELQEQKGQGNQIAIPPAQSGEGGGAFG